MTTRDEKIAVLQARAVDLGGAEIDPRYARRRYVVLAANGAFCAALNVSLAFAADSGRACALDIAAAAFAIVAVGCARRAVVWHGRHGAIAKKSRRAHQAFYRGAS